MRGSGIMEKEVKIIKMTPDQLGYKDRGIMKWQGLILSAQTDAIKDMERKEREETPIPKEKMSEEDISEVLQLSFIKKAPIVMQADIMRNGRYYKDLKCMVLGYADDKIYMRLIDGRQVKCEMHQIRHVDFMDPLEWFNKK